MSHVFATVSIPNEAILERLPDVLRERTGLEWTGRTEALSDGHHCLILAVEHFGWSVDLCIGRQPLVIDVEASLVREAPPTYPFRQVLVSLLQLGGVAIDSRNQPSEVWIPAWIDLKWSELRWWHRLRWLPQRG